MSLEMTEDAFRRAVQARVVKEVSPLEALYQTLDEYQAEEHAAAGVKPACAKNCSACCYQMVAVWELEMETIWRYLERLSSPLRRQWRERLAKSVEEWRKYMRGRVLESPRQMADPIRLARDWAGKPCPFLETDGSCGVYEVRPLVCRTTTSPIRCESPRDLAKSGASQMRYQCEQWANRILMDLTAKEPGVAAMHEWFKLHRSRP